MPAVKCWNCGAEQKHSDEQGEKKVKCPRCHEMVDESHVCKNQTQCKRCGEWYDKYHNYCDYWEHLG